MSLCIFPFTYTEKTLSIQHWRTQRVRTLHPKGWCVLSSRVIGSIIKAWLIPRGRIILTIARVCLLCLNKSFQHCGEHCHFHLASASTCHRSEASHKSVCVRDWQEQGRLSCANLSYFNGDNISFSISVESSSSSQWSENTAPVDSSEMKFSWPALWLFSVSNTFVSQSHKLLCFFVFMLITIVKLISFVFR